MQPRRWHSDDDASSRSIRYSKGGAVTTWTQRNRTARRHPRRRERLVDQAEAGQRSRVVQCSRALRPASAAATLATAKSLRLDRRGVASINGLPRSPSAAAARTRRARRRCYSTPSPPRVASGRQAAPSVSSRSCPAARGARVHVSPRGGSVGVLLHGCPELISTRGSQTKRCAGQNISRGGARAWSGSV